MSKDLRNTTAPPMQRLRERKEGKEFIQTHPLEVDRVMREARCEIYKGNACPQRQQRMLDTHLKRCGKQFKQRTASPVEDITANMLDDLIQAILAWTACVRATCAFFHPLPWIGLPSFIGPLKLERPGLLA